MHIGFLKLQWNILSHFPRPRMNTLPTTPPFKTCSKCGQTWSSARSFVEDPTVKLNGYLPDFNDSANGLIIVTHRIKDCNSSISVKTTVFEHLYTGPKHKEHMRAEEGCTGKCFMYDDFSSCSNECDMRWVREVMSMIQKNHLIAAPVEKAETIFK